VWVEPASAAGLAGLAKEIQAGTIDVKAQIVVTVCTGHGLKDPEIATANMPSPKKIATNLAALEKELMRD
jgi:threonine synthase